MLFNSLVESGIYWGVPKENSYRMSWFCRQRIVTDVPNDLSKPVYSQLGSINGVEDPTGRYRHSGGENYDKDFNQFGVKRFITNTTEWDGDKLRLYSFLPTN